MTVESFSLSDEGVLERAVGEERLLIAFDGDHGRSSFREAAVVPIGVVYLRLTSFSLREPEKFFVALLVKPELSLMSMLTVVERERTRQRPLP